MTGTTLATCLAGIVPAATLLVAGLSHGRHPGRLAVDLRRQGLVPHRAVGVLAAALPVIELSLGAAVIAWLHGWATTAGTAALGGAILLYGAFTVYTWALLRDGGGRRVPCGCAPRGAAITSVVPLRAGALAALSLAALLTSPSAAALSTGEFVVAGLAAGTFTGCNGINYRNCKDCCCSTVCKKCCGKKGFHKNWNAYRLRPNQCYAGGGNRTKDGWFWNACGCWKADGTRGRRTNRCHDGYLLGDDGAIKTICKLRIGCL